MSVPRRRLTSCWLALVLVAAAVHAATTTEVAWFQLEPGCPVRPEAITPGGTEVPQVVLCGDEGSYIFGKRGLAYDGECHSLDRGTEEPAPIPVEPPPRLPREFPCYQGSCLHRTGRPWVAILDWPTAHGWSVAATIQEAADQEVDVELYDLGAAGTAAPWLPHVSDLHVLVELCAVAEAARLHPEDRPLAVNMSFGRLDTSHCATSGTGLCGSVGRVLSRLADMGIVPVAAAGNHHELLFPASTLEVVSAGALDLSHLQHSQQVMPSTQTPQGAEALMLGYGIYLSYLSAHGGEAWWPAPPGSSYAAALFTGWLGGMLAGGEKLPPVPIGARWTPIATANGLALALDGVPLPGSELNGPRLLLERALGTMVPVPHQKTEAALRLEGPAPPLPELSLLHADDGNGPQPGVNPCVPCQGEGRQGGTPESPDTVFVDLSYSSGLPAQVELIAVFLRVGEKVYRFEGSRAPDLLAAISAGSLETLALSNVGDLFEPGEQPSLVLVVNVGGPAYWHEVPLHLQR
jgi:hypothetical protein